MKLAQKLSAAGALAGLCLCLTVGGANAGPLPTSMGDVARAGVPALLEEVQFQPRRVGPRGPRIAGPRVGGPRVARGGRWGGRAVGAGIAAGILGGIAAGALMAQPAAPPPPVYGEPVYGGPPVYAAPAYGAPVYAPRRGGSVEYCMQRYRSYNPQTGTYIGLDGIERPCP